jgi:hypothetical protein
MTESNGLAHMGHVRTEEAQTSQHAQWPVLSSRCTANKHRARTGYCDSAPTTHKAHQAKAHGSHTITKDIPMA